MYCIHVAMCLLWNAETDLNNNKLIDEKLICAFRWSVLPSIMKIHGPKNKTKYHNLFKIHFNIIPIYAYVVCPKSKCTDFLFNYLLDLSEITSYLLRSMTLGKLHSGSNVSSTDHSSTGSHFP